MKGIYETAVVLLNRSLKSIESREIESLYCLLKSRDRSPEKWEKQIKFWSSLIKKWGVEGKVIEFSVDELSQAFTFREMLPPLQPALDYLVGMKILKTKEDSLKNPSLMGSLTNKLFGLIWQTTPKSEYYVFTDRLKNKAKKIFNNIESAAAFSTEMVLTNDELKETYFKSNKCSFEVLIAELERNKKIKKFQNGYYFMSNQFSKLSDDVVESVLNTKNTISTIENRISELENSFLSHRNRAKTFLAKKRKNDAKSELLQAKRIEASVHKFYEMKSQQENILHRLAECDTISIVANEMMEVNKVVKKMNLPSADHVSNAADELTETVEALDQIANVNFGGAQFDDDEIEAELNNLDDDRPNSQSNYQTNNYNHDEEEEPIQYGSSNKSQKQSQRKRISLAFPF
ncbi:hypothetical protein TRFO_31433 [Tritrichomonas foetus]|uniref:Charged multivesicular body protein 7 n=1 Tax=Tritrichomonas foetus TaxID=1144522 RepID=A0A1J4JRN2_9EUKA|nr:hypothetical protein TRFO_31433 [Tritrichomonas foetus]|eukprot:OHT01683.1 hypothetical protein TRFO_31433 [Tritrichomonas foetus]